MITLTIDNQKIAVEEGQPSLRLPRNGNQDPDPCYLKDINVIGACRICVVEVQGPRLMPACGPGGRGYGCPYQHPGCIKARKLILELILSDHPMECSPVSAN